MAKKTNNKPRKGKKVLYGIFYTILMFFFFGVLAVCAIGTMFFVYIAANAPTFDESKLYTSEPSEIYDSDGKLLATIGTEDRVLLTYDEIPDVLINAIVATEDSRFFQHNGIDLPRFIVASVKQVLKGDGGGASTLTMQISKNVYTSTEATGWEGIVRKFTDVYLAVFKIEPSYSKHEILEFYVNSFYLGGGYGVETTAKNYFGKSAKDLNLAEAALIAGLYQAPGSYNPRSNPELTEWRRETVLGLMKRHSYITEEEYNIAMKMTTDKIVQEHSGVDIGSGIIDENNQLFVDMVIQDVTRDTGNSPYTTSMKIYTTLNTKFQKHVADIMNGKTYTWKAKKVQAGISVVDIRTGAIVAIGGGRNVTTANSLNRATQIKRQIGSTAKPLYDYGPAVEYLNWNTGTMINDSKTTYSDGTAISNWDGGYYGWNTITYHLKTSRNIPALKAFKATTNEQKVKFVTSLGLSPEIYTCEAGYKLSNKKCVSKEDKSVVIEPKTTKMHEAHAIGGYNGESPLTMASAYAAFGNGGYYNEPYSYTKIKYPDTGDVYINKTVTNQVMNDSTAYIITKMLQETASYGIDSGSYKDVNGIKYAAKTGTTNFDEATKKRYKLPGNAINEYWVVGFNTEYAIAVWYGYDKITDGYLTLGGSQHQRLFQAVAKGVFKDKSDFKMPSSVIKVTTEASSGTLLLPGSNTPSSDKTTSYFISGTEPNSTSTKYNKLNDVTNLTAVNNGDGTASVTWTPISTPDAFNTSYLQSITKSSKVAEPASYASYILGRNKSSVGALGYDIYLVKNGVEEFKGWTSSTSYTVSAPNGDYSIVVRSAYKSYKANSSSGKSTSVTITGSSIIEPPVIIPEENDNNNNNNDNSNNN